MAPPAKPRVLACIDPAGNTDAVIDWAAWAALRLAAPLEFLHVLERHPERAGTADLSGAIGVDARESLLQALSEQDAQRSRAQREAGRVLLAHARSRAAAAGATPLDARLRHGELVDSALELQPGTGLFVLGEHAHAQTPRRTDHHLEQVVRALQRPVLVATREGFEAPRRGVIAFDGSARARRWVDAAARHPLLAGLPLTLAMAGHDSTAARQRLDEAGRALAAAGVQAQTERLGGAPAQALPAFVAAQGPALLVMGAYGHSRLRQWLLGSTTTTLLRLGGVSVLLLR